MTGPNAGDFSEANTCGATLAPSAQCTLSVVLTPSAAGARTASVVFTDNATGSPHAVGLSGTGTASAVALSTSSLTFASQTQGAASSAQSVTLTNSSNQTLTITSIAVTGTNSAAFSEANTCGTSISAGSSCTIFVTFNPTATGTLTATLTISDSASATPEYITLSGTGDPPSATFSPASLSFGSQALGKTSSAQQTTLTNTSNVPLSVSSLAVFGGNASAFAETNNCGTTLAAGANCSISVTFTPAASGSLTANVGLPGNSYGVGSAHRNRCRAGISLSQTSINFGSQVMGSTSPVQSFSLTNTGTADLSLSGIAVTGANSADFAQTNACGSTVAAGASCTINVTFKPVAAGALAAAVTLTDNATGGSTQSVTLSGTGVNAVAAASLSQTSLAFGSQAVNYTSPAQTVTVTNSGNTALTISSISVTGANAGDFAQTNTCGSSVAAGAGCTISVTFKPPVTGSLTGAVTLTDNAPGSTQSVSLSGTGVTTAASASLSPTSLTFGSQNVGTTSAAQTITLSNTGNAALSISSIALTGADPGDFAQTNTCGSSVAIGANCTISVTFKPPAAGSLTAVLTLTDNASSGSQNVGLSGTGQSVAAGASLSPTSLAFGSQNVGTTSAAQTIILSNSGNAALTISSIALTGANPGDFIETNTCGSSVAIGANCTISVAFKPPAAGSLAAAVTLTDNAPSGTQSVSLSGTGASTAAAVSLSPGSLAFGSQNVGSTSAAQTITLSNTGNAALTISSIALTGANPGDFGQTNTCGSSVAAGANCTISVTFKPPATGSLTASVTVTDNAPSGTQSVSLSGTGTSSAPAVSVSPTSLAFGSQTVGTTSAAQTITLSNTGNAALTISSIALSGANPGDFGQTNTCGSSVAAGANCTISVSFKPPATGTLTASVTLTDNAPSGTQSVSLSGTGASSAPAASLSPTSLTFGSQTVGTTSAAQTITLSNTGNAALTISGIALTGADPGDFTQTNTCGSSVAAGANCTISVTFKPPATGTLTASVTLTDNASSGTQTVGLSGTGASTAASVSLSTTSLSFGNQAADVTSPSQVVTLSNKGGSSLSISSMTFTGADASDFAESDTCGSSVAAAGTCTIAVQFTPAATGARSAALSIADNATGSPQSVSLSGTGTHDVMLSWTASATSGVTGYYVYRGTKSGGESSTPLNSTPISGTSFRTRASRRERPTTTWLRPWVPMILPRAQILARLP